MFLGFSLDELMEVVRTCDAIEIEDCTPDYLQDFIAQRLDADFPVLANRVRLLNAEQMDALCEYIKDTHFLIRQ
ncbi:MAG TPA: hypothetical protein VFB96_14960 [Pirellulaceae bacterium]|jgi:hypothetical protein|nr:hypothetical protein [Pirellulaceae bacterium]